MTNKLKKLLLIPSLLIAFSSAAADQAGTPISISSDRQVGQLKNGVGIFEENVEITHGNRRITADRLEAHAGEVDGTVSLIIATGKPAYFEEKQEDGTVMSASADEVRYDVAKRLITLVVDAQVKQAGQKVSAKSIKNVKRKKVLA